MQSTLAALFASALLVLSAQAATNFVTTTPMSPLQRPVRFDNQMLLRLPKTKQFFELADKLNLDVWSVGKATVQVRADAKQKRDLERLLKAKSTVLNANIQQIIDRETAELNKQIQVSRKFAVGDDSWHKQYHPFDDIINWYKGVAAKYPDLVKFKPSVGKTLGGKDLPLVEITGTGGSGDKKHLWVQFGIHAREWISGATGQFIADKLTSGYGTDARITSLLDKVRIVLIPIVNPDGYSYTWNGSRLWRKNRNGQGVDINRNYPDHWALTGGASTSPSSETYKGPSAGSEAETKALMAAYQSYSAGMIGAIDFHSYSQLLLRPYGWTNNKSPDEAAFSQLGSSMKSIIKSSRGTDYTSQPSIDLYMTTGTASDWFYGSSTTAKGQFRSYGITIELSPDSSDWNGFVLPPDQIIPVGTEIFPAFLTYSEFCLNKPLIAN
jgi:hypothetical protein